MELFEMVNNRAIPNMHVVLIEPFLTIWNEDTSPGKGEAIDIFSYVELLCSPKKSNPFSGYSEMERPAKVREEVWGDANYNHPKVGQIINAVLTYKKFLVDSSESYSLYLSATNAADKLKLYLDTVNLNERTNGGAAVTKPADITRAIKEVPDVIRSLQGLKEKVNTELAEASKTRNQREIGLFER